MIFGWHVLPKVRWLIAKWKRGIQLQTDWLAVLVTELVIWNRVCWKLRLNWIHYENNASSMSRWLRPLWSRGTHIVCSWLRQLQSTYLHKVTDIKSEKNMESWEFSIVTWAIHENVLLLVKSWVRFLLRPILVLSLLKVYHLRNFPWHPPPGVHLQLFPLLEHQLHWCLWPESQQKHWKPKQLCNRWSCLKCLLFSTSERSRFDLHLLSATRWQYYTDYSAFPMLP